MTAPIAVEFVRMMARASSGVTPQNNANVVIWQAVFEEFAILIKTAPFIGVSGKIQKQDGVV